jgi:hypothetical protein
MSKDQNASHSSFSSKEIDVYGIPKIVSEFIFHASDASPPLLQCMHFVFGGADQATRRVAMTLMRNTIDSIKPRKFSSHDLPILEHQRHFFFYKCMLDFGRGRNLFFAICQNRRKNKGIMLVTDDIWHMIHAECVDDE